MEGEDEEGEASSEQSSAGRRRLGAGRWERRLPRSARLVSQSPAWLMTADRSRHIRSPSGRTPFRAPGSVFRSHRPRHFRGPTPGSGGPGRESMARKLQSDKWLFLATLALVCISVVMVYSASAVVALDRYQQPYYFVTRQVLWAVLGLAVLSIVMRVDYRTYKNDQVVWVALAVVAALLDRRALRPADQRVAALVRHRRVRRAALGAGQGGGGVVHRHHPRPADGPDQRRRLRALADCADHRRRWPRSSCSSPTSGPRPPWRSSSG